MSYSTQRALQAASDRIVAQEKQIQRALQVLQRAQRYLPKNSTEMERCTDGDYVDISDVQTAIKILEGQQ